MSNSLLSLDHRSHSIAGIPSKHIIERLSKNRGALRAALKSLSHPNFDQYREASVAELCEQVKLAAEFESRTWRGKQKPHPGDLLLVAIEQAEMPEADRRAILGGVETESDLTEPVANYLHNKHDMKVVTEVPIGDRRADLVGFEKSWLGRHMIAVELKNAPRTCESLHDQIAAYRKAADRVWVVGTPQFMIQYTLSLDALCTPTRVADTMKEQGAALVIYDAASKSFTPLCDGLDNPYDEAQYDDLWKYLDQSASTSMLPAIAG